MGRFLAFYSLRSFLLTTSLQCLTLTLDTTTVTVAVTTSTKKTNFPGNATLRCALCQTIAHHLNFSRKRLLLHYHEVSHNLEKNFSPLHFLEQDLLPATTPSPICMPGFPLTEYVKILGLKSVDRIERACRRLIPVNANLNVTDWLNWKSKRKLREALMDSLVKIDDQFKDFPKEKKEHYFGIAEGLCMSDSEEEGNNNKFSNSRNMICPRLWRVSEMPWMQKEHLPYSDDDDDVS